MAAALEEDVFERTGIERVRAALKAEFGPARRYLSDNDEQDIRLAFGGLGKHGALGFGPGDLWVDGAFLVHSIGLHAGHPDVLLQYDIGAEWGTLRGGVAMADSNGGVTTAPLTFEILGDGVSLWKSEPIRHWKAVQEFTAHVSGVRILELRIKCDGRDTSAHTVWVEPELFR